MNANGWRTVSRNAPCPICHKGDWCGTHTSGITRCMRVPSDRHSNGGWIHGKASTPPPAIRQRREYSPHYPSPDFDAEMLWQGLRFTTRPHKLTAWACSLGLPPTTLDWLGAVTLGDTLMFPMYDGLGAICGFRTRTKAGEKKALYGSKAGLFTTTVQTDAQVLICEGPTDAAAAMALGFEPIGRPSCDGQQIHVIHTLKRWGLQEATICADADGPGIAGANRLADALRASRIRTRLVAPHRHKDLRAWWQAGARREDVDLAWSQAQWRV